MAKKKKSRSIKDFVKQRDELLKRGRTKKKGGPGKAIGAGAAAGAKQRKKKK